MRGASAATLGREADSKEGSGPVRLQVRSSPKRYMSRSWTRLRGLPAAVIVGLIVATYSPAMAQSGASSDREDGVDWSLLDAIGYGGLGFGTGLLAAWDMEGTDLGPPGEALALIGGATLAGTFGGWIMGDRAEDAIALGHELRSAHRAAAIAGVVLAGATAGALASIPFVSSGGAGTPFGSDEETVALLVGAGAVLGSLYAWMRRDEGTDRRFRIVPALLEPNRYGLRVRVH